MLVLSRRRNDQVVFPNLGITIEILRIAGSSVRIGVRAPSDVRVLRNELAEKEGIPAGRGDFQFPAKKLSHRVRNRLNSATLAVYLMQKQSDMGRSSEAEETLRRVLDEFAAIDREIAETERRPQDRPQDRPQHCRALIVEDDANESELLAGFLRASGFEVDTAGDGCEAIEYLSTNQRPDVVLLDMCMPRCDGRSTVSAIRRNPEYDGLRIFAVSGSEPAECGVQVGPTGVDRWFSKPIDPRMLVTQMSRELKPRIASGSFDQ
jgi:carbon storage regulator CsrA